MPVRSGNSRFYNNNNNNNNNNGTPPPPHHRAAGQGSNEDLLAGGQGGYGRRAHRRTREEAQPLHHQPAQLQHGGPPGQRAHHRGLGRAVGKTRREGRARGDNVTQAGVGQAQRPLPRAPRDARENDGGGKDGGGKACQAEDRRHNEGGGGKKPAASPHRDSPGAPGRAWRESLPFSAKYGKPL